MGQNNELIPWHDTMKSINSVIAPIAIRNLGGSITRPLAAVRPRPANNSAANKNLIESKEPRTCVYALRLAQFLNQHRCCV